MKTKVSQKEWNEMNRAIKFRGVRQKYLPNVHESIFKFGNLLSHNCIGEVGCDIEHYEYAKVIPKTIGQFTGIKDRNEKEIYEGDLLKIANDEIIEVIFKSGQFLGLRKNGTISRTTLYWKYAEIIGNVYNENEGGENE
jgi:uncharacterized phage protein (TIGR01671 family)